MDALCSAPLIGMANGMSYEFRLGFLVICGMLSRWSVAGLVWRPLAAKRSVTLGPRLCSSRDETFNTTEASSMQPQSPSLLLRKQVLRKNLLALGIDADEVEHAVQQSMVNSTAGYDDRYGRSAIRTCLSFYYPKKGSTMLLFGNDNMQLEAAGIRTARQIEFLTKRHQAHQTAWIRHHDAHTSPNGRAKQFPLVLLLDNLRSAHNVGSLFRTADAAGCAQVITVGITPHPMGSGAEKLQKSALGAELVVPSRHFATIHQALDYLRLQGRYQLVGMETTAQSRLYTDFDYDSEGVVLVLGNEVTGVDATILSELDGIVEIPMFGTKNSLNVAACAPIVLYEIIRQWNKAQDAT